VIGVRIACMLEKLEKVIKFRVIFCDDRIVISL